MGWDVIAGLVIQYGIPFTEYLVNKIATKEDVTPAEWAELKALANLTARQELINKLNAAGIPLDSQQAVALLALVP